MVSYPDFEIFCAGDFISTGDRLEVINPYNGKPVAATSLAGAAELETAIAAAMQVKEELSQMPAYSRYEILMSVSSGIASLRQQFAELITIESGKPIRNALAEVDRSIQTFAVAAEESRRQPGEYLRLDWTRPGQNREGLLKYFPVGLVAGISPFNFPLNLAVHKIAPAIAAGCPIILKPSSLTPLSTLFLARLIATSGLPKGAVSVLPMNRQTGNLLVTDERFRLLSFTGSPEVGWKMKRDAGSKKVVLELGGNAGVIVSSTADLQRAAGACVQGAFAYMGQVCIHTQRIYVIRSLFDDFVSLFISKTQALKQGDPMDPETDISAMIDEANAKRVESWIAEAVSGGARVLSGGKRSGSFIEPTVVTNTSDGMKVCSDEVFGPVVAVEAVDSFAEAVERVNAGRFGLQAGVFTGSEAETAYAFRHLEVGGVIINDTPSFRVDHMPYGGVKDSGSGREGVRYAMMDMLEPKLLVKEM